VSRKAETTRVRRPYFYAAPDMRLLNQAHRLQGILEGEHNNTRRLTPLQVNSRTKYLVGPTSSDKSAKRDRMQNEHSRICL
jgi:hypothetical protein